MKLSDFEVIPAIDILGGKCVRLTQGQYDQVEQFSNKPDEIAKKWVELGANRLHVVDLDGAKEGHPVNFKAITNLVKATSAKVQVGGGIRTVQSIKEYINEGISYIILGTKAFQDKIFLNQVLETYGEKIIIGLDLKNNRVALSGWHETCDIKLEDLKESIGQAKQIIYTDISKDGTLTGPNLKSVETIASSFKSEIIVSGGVSSTEDILAILNIKKKGRSNISGVILGKSLYKGMINLDSAIKLVKKELETKI